MTLFGPRPQGDVQILKFGTNPDIDQGGVDVWDCDGECPWFNIDNEVFIEMLSSNEDDFKTGDGAREVTVIGLDQNFNEISETNGLNGLTPVLFEKGFIRVYRAYVTEAGITRTNLGDITIRRQDNEDLMAKIRARFGQTQMTIYTLPRRTVDGRPIQKALLYAWGASLASASISGNAEVSLDIRLPGSAWRVQRSAVIQSSGTSKFSENLVMPIVVLPKTDIRVHVHNVSQPNIGISADFSMMIVISTEG